ncbi:AraC family transcriptional regulator [Pseudomonas corrugata]|uniref:AraC family transcriptional regulator n=2 Tax=Pseudomonas fluorescens group TaxID=136843 RepID=A0A7Y5Z8P9_9PSED|nr:MULTISPECIES: helix-turn-helix domain-containing protein [Pseudomonas fluorescens group]MBL0844626.1 AraC family transcriptional regulator [Pseudomonas mediterranea]MCI0996602.1 AraC family transcriptional regulator [Pseudomonas corrugata]NUT65602.1 AraC family transcriptional regulator [Pseudomonas corrugata]NUT89103.1 AraC family transcriptional regulator [Pseudomonas corrugata]UZE02855.1 helix-turn-helix domain-containing protein [Pseudomonas mediterranea]
MPMPTRQPDTQFRFLESHDAFEHAGGLEEWDDNRYHQLEKRARFHGAIASHSIAGKVQVTRETMESPYIEQICHVPLDSIVIVNVRSSADVLLNGRYVNANTFHISSGRSFHSVSRAPIEALMLTVKKSDFLEQFRTDGHLNIDAKPFERFIQPSSETQIDFETNLKLHLSHVQSGCADATDRSSLANVFACVQEILDFDTGSSRFVVPPSTRTYIVEKSCEFFARHLQDENIGVLDLCNHLRISRRTLQYSFEDVLGMTPLNYIRSVRLNTARKLLVQSPSDTIQGAALDAGFSHLGRFSKYYQEFFGELPSQTVGRLGAHRHPH